MIEASFLYTDDIKLYAATHNKLQEILRLTQTFSRNIKMLFGVEKCKTLSIAKGKLQMRNLHVCTVHQQYQSTFIVPQ
jgi:hypothetical protein